MKIWIVFTKSKVGIEPHPGWIQNIYDTHDAAIRSRDDLADCEPYSDHFIREYEVERDY
jgi:hypothetical protein